MFIPTFTQSGQYRQTLTIITMKKVIRMILSNSRNSIVFFETTVDEDGLILEERRASMKIYPDPNKGQTAESTFAAAHKYEWEIDEDKEPNEDWYQIKRVGLAVQPQLATADSIVHN